MDLGALTLCVERDEQRVGMPLLCLGGLGMQLSAWLTKRRACAIAGSQAS